MKRVERIFEDASKRSVEKRPDSLARRQLVEALLQAHTDESGFLPGGDEVQGMTGLKEEERVRGGASVLVSRSSVFNISRGEQFTSTLSPPRSFAPSSLQRLRNLTCGRSEKSNQKPVLSLDC